MKDLQSYLAFDGHESYKKNIVIYDKAMSNPSWEYDIDWQRDDRLMPPDLFNFGIRLASQSIYAEQLGMVTSAKLLAECESFSLRLGLATAVADESRHVNVFTKYIHKFHGTIPEPASHWNKVANEMNENKSFLYKFFVHTMLENQALEVFGLLIKIFKSYIIGDIYNCVRQDESRHVALGINFLSTKVKETPSLKDEILLIYEESLPGVGVSLQACERYASFMEEVNAQDIYEMMLKKQKNMLKLIIE
ncbi:hypothetical protein NIES23_63800 (plasmid) [Trichormus variabilis NIES-23]|uniref:Uncharacterized protein n=1 Tax=Trichormus variabilis NIES-23 TaxID=1973479 RepID=A0A1Z4KX85_ANAVA|nr:hypothetical protein NIES23_63800 [Trichormus variabilis NIES-23]